MAIQCGRQYDQVLYGAGEHLQRETKDRIQPSSSRNDSEIWAYEIILNDVR